jgi:hypothetical protein
MLVNLVSGFDDEAEEIDFLLMKLEVGEECLRSCVVYVL